LKGLEGGGVESRHAEPVIADGGYGLDSAGKPEGNVEKPPSRSSDLPALTYHKFRKA
jgi:hypothetical protein